MVQAAVRNASSRLNQLSTWFQLVKFRVTMLSRDRQEEPGVSSYFHP